MTILRSFFGRILGLFRFPNSARANHIALLSSQSSIRDVADIIPSLGRGEVLIKKSPGGETFDVFTIDELTPEQLLLLSRGKAPKGITVFTL